jgi:hypothetical protein
MAVVFSHFDDIPTSPRAATPPEPPEDDRDMTPTRLTAVNGATIVVPAYKVDNLRLLGLLA